jgi:hypothetical protein
MTKVCAPRPPGEGHKAHESEIGSWSSALGGARGVARGADDARTTWDDASRVGMKPSLLNHT